MELLQLRYFLTTAEYQHMTKAAEHLQIAQPALSQAIHRLESELGIPLFEGTAVSCYMLYESREKTTFLLYLRSGLMEYLAETDVKRLMERFGYHAMKLERILERVSEKYTSHMDGTGGFPHEIGLLLGYPPADVLGFIQNNGRNYLCTGYWKVYSNQSECKRIFRGYSQAREMLIHMVSRGMGIGDILKIHGLHQYKSMTI